MKSYKLAINLGSEHNLVGLRSFRKPLAAPAAPPGWGIRSEGRPFPKDSVEVGWGDAFGLRIRDGGQRELACG